LKNKKLRCLEDLQSNRQLVKKKLELGKLRLRQLEKKFSRNLRTKKKEEELKMIILRI
jgi:hypothetical protein